MAWWGWGTLSVYIIVMWYIARKFATHEVEKAKQDKYHKIIASDYLLNGMIGILIGMIWPFLILFALLTLSIYPKELKEIFRKFYPSLSLDESSEPDKTLNEDTETRKQIEQLRREYAMPRWKRFILKLIRV